MRITQNMTTNKMLLNINRNATNVDSLYNQLTTGKKIQFPSDNPIIASRALKFRTNIAETAQYKRNTAQGISWMEITEQGFSNLNTIMKSIRDLCDQAANDTLTVTDRQNIAAEIQMLYQQIGSEMNVSYAGRYVFSGYRTDEPPVLTADNKSKYVITQKMTTGDIEQTRAYAKTGVGIAPEEFGVSRLKLPYSNVTDITFTATDTSGAVTNYAVTTVSLNTGTPTSGGVPQLDDNAYTPGDDEIYYVQETGELILGANVAKEINVTGAGGLDIIYAKQGFTQGELNPRVYFECTQILDDNGNPLNLTFQGALAPDGAVFGADTNASFGITQSFNGADITAAGALALPYTDATGMTLEVNGTAYTVTSVNSGAAPGSSDIYYERDTGKLVFGTDFLAGGADEILAADAITVSYTKSGFSAGDLDPRTNLNSVQTADVNGNPLNKTYTMDKQELQFEFGTNTRITINNLSKDVYTAQLYADLKSLTEEIGSIKLSTEAEIRARLAAVVPPIPADEIDQMVKDQQTEEEQKYRGILHDRFNNMLKLIDDHSAQISTEYTKLGSRMNRLDLISSRLEEDTVSYTKLMGDNENVDYLEVIMRLNSAESVYQAAMKAGASIMQISLVDFIR